MEGRFKAQTDGVDALTDDDLSPAEPIRAAGGVVVLDGRILLVHRPRYDDWSLPKGKLKRGEHPLAGALREVEEETGVRGIPGARLPTATYEVWSHDSLVDKQVDYWAMRVDPALNPPVPAGDGPRGDFSPGDEVDDIAWVPVSEALNRLSYAHDRRVLRAFADLPALTRPVVLLRHATAGERLTDPGADRSRALDEHGERQAAALAPLLALFGPARLVSAEPLRCQQTLAELAFRRNQKVEMDQRFNEDASPGDAAQAIRRLASTDQAAVVCSQGKLIPAVIAQLRAELDPQRYRTAKGDGWVLSFAGERLAAVDLLTLTETRPRR
jgi:8-oxo-dGTP diphosphatase